MELILKITNHDYKMFLNSNVDALVIALEGFSCDYLIDYPLDDLPEIITNIKKHNKKVYLSLNIIANEDTTKKLETLINQILALEVDGYVVSDFGFLQIFKENNQHNRVIFNPVTTITNKYSSKIANDLGINHVCIANELNFNDILDIANYTNGNIEILAQGYYQICNSKRALISNFLKKLKIKKNSSTYYIKEESRDYAYPIVEINNDLFVYTDKQRSLLTYLKPLKNANIKYYRIDTTLLNYDDINKIIDIYHNALKEDKYEEEYVIQLENLNSNMKCLDNVSILKKEGK